MPATVMGLLCQFIIQPILNKLAECMEIRNENELKMLIFKILKIIIGLGVTAIIIAYFCGIPVLKIVYGIELTEYLLPFIIIMIGAVLYSIELFLSTVLIAMRKTFLQAILYLLVSVISTVIAYVLVERYSILGASIGYFITMLIITIALFIYLIICFYRELKKNDNKKILKG